MSEFIYRENMKYLKEKLAQSADETRQATIREIIKAEQKRHRENDAAIDRS